MNNLSIFDQRGDVLKVINPDEVAKLDATDQGVLEVTLVACKEAEDQDALVNETRKLVHHAMAAHDAAVKADIEANPPQTHYEAHQAAIAANAGLKVKAPKKPSTKTRAALATGIIELANLRSDFTQALAKQKVLNRVRGERILLWMATQTPVTALSLARAAAASYVPNPSPDVVHRHPIDQVGRDGKNRQRTPGNLKAFAGAGLPIIRDVYKAR